MSPETFLRTDLTLAATLPNNVKQSAIARTGTFLSSLDVETEAE